MIVSYGSLEGVIPAGGISPGQQVDCLRALLSDAPGRKERRAVLRQWKKRMKRTSLRRKTVRRLASAAKASHDDPRAR